MVLILFGTKYAGALPVLVWLAVMQAVRVAKMGVSVVALARGETRSPMVANIPRVLLLPVAWLALERGAGMETVVGIAILGEAIGLAVAFALLRSWLGVPVRPLIPAVLAWGGVLALVVADAALRPRQPEVFANFHLFQGVILLAAAAAVLLAMRDLRARASACCGARRLPGVHDGAGTRRRTRGPHVFMPPGPGIAVPYRGPAERNKGEAAGQSAGRRGSRARRTFPRARAPPRGRRPRAEPAPVPKTRPRRPRSSRRRRHPSCWRCFSSRC